MASGTIKRVARWTIGDQLLGYLDYYRYPERKRKWGGPFNGQTSRLALFHVLMDRLSPAAIVETGTYLGETTEFLAEFDRPVFTVEADSRAYGFAKARLRKRRNVTLLHGDSREELRQMFEGPLQAFAGLIVFFYLDAHWNDDLPLAEEIDIVFSQCGTAVVMVDDFRVPHYPAYGYDDYGPAKTLNFAYIAPAVAAHDLVAFYPATPPAAESGARRGTVILARRAVHDDALSLLPLLCPAGTNDSHRIG